MWIMTKNTPEVKGNFSGQTEIAKEVQRYQIVVRSDSQRCQSNYVTKVFVRK